MRMHIELEDRVVVRLDALAGPRGRSAFVRAAIERAIEVEERLRALDAAAGSIEDSGHEWDEDPAAWVRAQRNSDPERVG